MRTSALGSQAPSIIHKLPAQALNAGNRSTSGRFNAQMLQVSPERCDHCPAMQRGP